MQISLVEVFKQRVKVGRMVKEALGPIKQFLQAAGLSLAPIQRKRSYSAAGIKERLIGLLQIIRSPSDWRYLQWSNSVSHYIFRSKFTIYAATLR